jgi:hypothetical protein
LNIAADHQLGLDDAVLTGDAGAEAVCQGKLIALEEALPEFKTTLLAAR